MTNVPLFINLDCTNDTAEIMREKFISEMRRYIENKEFCLIPENRDSIIIEEGEFSCNNRIYPYEIGYGTADPQCSNNTKLLSHLISFTQGVLTGILFPEPNQKQQTILVKSWPDFQVKQDNETKNFLYMVYFRLGNKEEISGS